MDPILLQPVSGPNLEKEMLKYILKAHNAKAVKLGSKKDLLTTPRGSEKATNSRGSRDTRDARCSWGAYRGLLWFPLLSPKLLKDKLEAY